MYNIFGATKYLGADWDHQSSNWRPILQFLFHWCKIFRVRKIGITSAEIERPKNGVAKPKRVLRCWIHAITWAPQWARVWGVYPGTSTKVSVWTCNLQKSSPIVAIVPKLSWQTSCPDLSLRKKCLVKSKMLGALCAAWVIASFLTRGIDELVGHHNQDGQRLRRVHHPTWVAADNTSRIILRNLAILGSVASVDEMR